MTLRYSIRKNRYHSFIKLMMPTSGTFTITVNGVRTVKLAPGEALLFDPTEDITYAAVKDTKGISLLVASNYFHARTRRRFSRCSRSSGKRRASAVSSRCSGLCTITWAK